MGLSGLGERRTGELSGGQSRRVAIARTLASSPRVVLLDEPFAGLDVVSASEIRGLVARLITDLTAIVATHDALDAYALADDVAVMQAGRVAESGDAAQVLTRPRSAFAARMAGRVLVTGTMTDGALMLASGIRVPVVGGPELGASAAIAVRPAGIAIATEAQPWPPGVVWVEDSVTALEPRADHVRVHGVSLAADVDVAEAAGLSAGATVAFGMPTGLEAYGV